MRLPQGAFGFPSPFSSNGGPGYVQMSLLYDTLLWKDGAGELLPWLAESFERSADGLVYTFQLRPDLTWSDGTPLTAEDVVFTFEYYAAQESLPPPVIIQPPQGIAAVTATSPSTVEITLDGPVVTFAEQVAGALPIIPRHIWASIADPVAVQDPALLVGSGAYRLESYAGDEGPLLYVANDDYFLGAPFVQRLEFTAVEDQFSALLVDAVDAGSGDGVRADVLAPFEGDDRFGTITTRGTSTFPLYWNLTKGGPLADVQFRRACALAIDRNDLVTRLTGGSGEPGNPGFLGPDNPFRADVEQYEFDVTAANELLSKSGYAMGEGGTRIAPDGAPLRYELLVSNLDLPLAELIVVALAQIGVAITIKAVEVGPALFGTKLSGGYDMAILIYPGPSAGGPNADPDLLRQLFSSTSPPSLTGASGYVNPAFDDLAARQLVTLDETERGELVADMQQILAEDIPVLALYYPETVLVFRTDVLADWYFTPGAYPTAGNNKQLFITGLSSGREIRPIE
ncbi:MAG: hypothetical protein H0W46_08110 [Acidimicrobiia bacterium]|nr:hypothetical protein [Acidimicrobiia bacterium]